MSSLIVAIELYNSLVVKDREDPELVVSKRPTGFVATLPIQAISGFGLTEEEAIDDVTNEFLKEE